MACLVTLALQGEGLCIWAPMKIWAPITHSLAPINRYAHAAPGALHTCVLYQQCWQMSRKTSCASSRAGRTLLCLTH